MLVLALLLASHSASQGKSRFDVEPDGAVAVEIQLGALDLPELCNVDLSVASRRAEHETRLDECIARGMPFWLRISADGAACPITPGGWRELEPATTPPVIALAARARCAVGPRRLVIDWGLFRGTPLDHTSVARVRAPRAADRMFLFSKRASKLELDLDPYRSWRLAAWIGVPLLAIAALAAAARVLISRRRTRD